MKTYNLKESASLLGIHKETLRQKAAAKLIPACKPGKSWIFMEENLAQYPRSLYDENASQGDHTRRSNVWHSLSEKKSGGLTSCTKDSEYEKALGLQAQIGKQPQYVFTYKNRPANK